jgi:hypothetical protein
MISASAASAKPMYSCDRLNINMATPPSPIVQGNGGATAAATKVYVAFTRLHATASAGRRCGVSN